VSDRTKIVPRVYPHRTTPINEPQPVTTSIDTPLSGLVMGHIRHQRPTTVAAEHGAVGSGFESLAPHQNGVTRTLRTQGTDE
jgi:hypothetical protein